MDRITQNSGFFEVFWGFHPLYHQNFNPDIKKSWFFLQKLTSVPNLDIPTQKMANPLPNAPLHFLMPFGTPIHKEQNLNLNLELEFPIPEIFNQSIFKIWNSYPQRTQWSTCSNSWPDLRETIESSPLCNTDLFQNKLIFNLYLFL